MTWSCYWVFGNKKDASNFELGSHLAVQFHLIMVTIYMTIITHRTLYPDNLSHGMVECVLYVSLHNSETARKHAFVTLGTGLAISVKAIFSTFGSWIIAASKALEKHTVHFFLISKQLWSNFWVFWKKKSACHFFLRNHLTTVSPNLGKNRYDTQHSRNTVVREDPDHFSHGMVQCFLGVSLQSSLNTGKHSFVNLGIVPLW